MTDSLACPSRGRAPHIISAPPPPREASLVCLMFPSVARDPVFPRQGLNPSNLHVALPPPATNHHARSKNKKTRSVRQNRRRLSWPDRDSGWIPYRDVGKIRCVVSPKRNASTQAHKHTQKQKVNFGHSPLAACSGRRSPWPTPQSVQNRGDAQFI